MATGTKAPDPVVVTLHSQQAAVNRSRARFRALVTGRRWGKTTLEKVEGVQEFGTPGLVWYLAPTYDMARELMWEPVKALVPRAWLLREPNETRMELTTVWGCRFACKSVEHPDRLRGRGPRKVIGDEFQDWKDGRRIWEEVLLPSLLTTDGTALLAGTPKSFNHLYDVYQLGQQPGSDWASWQFRTADAPHIRTRLDYLAQMRREMDPRSYRQEFEASFEAVAGRAYYAFARTAHVTDVALDPALPVSVMFDFNINPAVGLIGQEQQDACRVWREVWIENAGGEATKASVGRVIAQLREARWQGPVRVYGDPAGRAGKTTGPSDHQVVREELRRAGWSVSWRIPHEAPHVRDRVAAVNGRFATEDGQSHAAIDRSCTHLIADLEQVVFKDTGDLDKTSNPMLTHISDALGYWIHEVWPITRVAKAGSAHVDWLL